MQEKLEKAWQLFDIGDYAASEEIYLECLKKTGEDDYENYASVLMGMIYTQSYMEKYDEARKYANHLIEIAPNDEEKHIALHQAGMVERMAGIYDDALKFFQLEAEIIDVAFSEDDMRIATNLYEQAYVNMKKGVLDKAEEVMNLSLQHAKKSEDAMCIGCAYRGLGEIMDMCGKQTQARNYFEQAIAAFELTGDSIAVDEVKVMLLEN